MYYVHNMAAMLNSLYCSEAQDCAAQDCPLLSALQVSDLPATSNAYRLQVAAAAADNATINTDQQPTPESKAVAAAAQLAAQQNVSAINSTNTTAALKVRLSRLSFGEQRALSEPFYLNISRVLIVPINGALQETDEVVNGRTAARLRGAFGWKPEDEHALLSRVYLDPYSSYWAKTLQILQSQNRSNSQQAGDSAQTAADANPPAADRAASSRAAVLVAAAAA